MLPVKWAIKGGKLVADGTADDPEAFPSTSHPVIGVTEKFNMGVVFGVVTVVVKNGATVAVAENDVTPALPEGVAIATKVPPDPHP